MSGNDPAHRPTAYMIDSIAGTTTRDVPTRRGDPLVIPGPWPWSDTRWQHTGVEEWDSDAKEWVPHREPHPDNTDAWRVTLRQRLAEELVYQNGGRCPSCGKPTPPGSVRFGDADTSNGNERVTRWWCWDHAEGARAARNYRESRAAFWLSLVNSRKTP